ncbi:multidrug DMT transporter permease [Burkholderia ubonensis]|uniref:Multidrug DMT transporter permease n=1 Tax=Burkholderia ubonensis TaxID=101571 RepID=A0AAU8UIE0_9BURK|nr:DMT family transporter [Burkholderia ubonensis]AOK23730.1 multidrug DMT transporter permease [Burkholderia ubonensis]KVM04833.1 multidrug DMT transporter permease [Burkholderia ubonensis]KVM06900.1 multidrug DMT transporter permease [Burkholderia ubonensis]KVM51635.1 multidrug DMT transporter permease [Burkholderia ubonensis]KVN91093.1 multidrug DMT transporter permease [Burkholderia ubonensis]
MNNAVRGSLPTLAILIGASVWGLIWYPLRVLASLGLTGTAASALTSVVAFLFVIVARHRAIATLRWHWVLPGIAVTAGITNLGFVWGTIHGEVLRVMLLFYLTPAWTAIYAHFLLRERLSWAGAGLAALSIGGAMLMLWSPRLGVPLPANPAEWAGLAAGLSFAMSNVLVVKASRELPQMRAEMRTATLFGGAAVFGAIASLFEGLPPVPTGGNLGVAALLVAGIGVTMASNNLLVQYGLARVPANRASIIMLFEIVITALSAWVFANELPGAREWAGGACIVLATLLSSRVHRPRAVQDKPGNGRDGARAMV